MKTRSETGGGRRILTSGGASAGKGAWVVPHCWICGRAQPAQDGDSREVGYRSWSDPGRDHELSISAGCGVGRRCAQEQLAQATSLAVDVRLHDQLERSLEDKLADLY